MPNNPPKRPITPFLRGLLQLSRDAVLGVTEVAEEAQRGIVHSPLLPKTPVQTLISGTAAWVYRSLRSGTRLLTGGLDKVLEQGSPLLGKATSGKQMAAFRAALNGVLGDHLEKTENPLCISMQLHDGDGRTIKKPLPPKCLLLLHGLCMNDEQWNHKGQHHGKALAKELDLKPLYLHYNTGRSIATNGKALSAILEELLLSHPSTELVFLAHSMGGLVARSALLQAQQDEKSWPHKLQKMIFLGTPHQGSPWEQIGTYVDTILENLPFTKPFAKLGKIRSVGINDLRQGKISPTEQHISLPKSADCYSIAAINGKIPKMLSTQILGDGLVPLRSALGQHKEADKDLGFKEAHTLVVENCTHFDLLSHPEVYAKIRSWLKSTVATANLYGK